MLNNWPLTGVTVRTGRVELRWPTPEDLDALADRAVEGVHAPGFMPFFSQWTDGTPAQVAQRVLQRHWRAMASWTPEDWTLYLVVVADGQVVGSQSLGGRDFGVTREVLLTSWLALGRQGEGLGGHARAAALELAFTGLGAEQAFSVVRRGNDASQGVCRKFGFERDGSQVNAVRGEQVVSDRFRLTRARWQAHRRIDAEVRGVAAALPFFGADAAEALPAPQAAPSGAVAGVPLASVLSGVRYAEESDQSAA